MSGKKSNGENPYPLESLRIAITYACNLKCNYCFNQQYGPISQENYISVDEIKECIDSAARIGLKTVSFTGGEPLLEYDRLLRLVKYANKRELDIGLLTNATLMDEQIANELKENGLGWARISLDNDDKHVNAIGRDEEYFENIPKTIRMLKDAGVEIILRPTILRENIDRLEQFIDFSTGMDVDRIEVRAFIPINDHCINQKFVLDVQEHLLFTKKILDLIRENQKRIDISLSEGWYSHLVSNINPKEVEKSKHGRTFGFLNPYGQLMTCPGNQCVLGNIREQDIADIWFNSAFLAKYRSQRPHKQCSDCRYVNHCFPCPTATLNLIGHIDHPPMDCPKIRQKTT